MVVFEMEQNEPEEELKEYQEVCPDDLSGDLDFDPNEEIVSLAEPTQESLPKIVAIIIKTTVRAHILLVPYCASILGWGLFPIVLVIIVVIHHFASILLLKVKNLSRHSNFSTIFYCIWPKTVSKLFGSSLLLLNNLFFCVLQFVLVKDTIVILARNIHGSTQQLGDIAWFWPYLIIIFMAIIEAPLIFVKRIQSLKMFSIIGVLGIIVFILGNIILFILQEIYGTFRTALTFQPWPQFEPYQFLDEQNPVTIFGSWLYIPVAISILIFTLTSNMNFYSIYKGLKEPTDGRMKQASIWGLLATTVIYATIGLMGYRISGKTLEPNILIAFRYHVFTDDASRWMWNYFLINIAYIVSVMFNVVLIFFTCKNNFLSIMAVLRKKFGKKKSSQLLEPPNEEEQIRRKNKEYKIYTVILYVVFVILSLFLDQLVALFSILGVLCSTLIFIIVPCFFYVMLICKEKQPKKAIYYISVVFMIIFIPFAVLAFVSTCMGNFDQDGTNANTPEH